MSETANIVTSPDTTTGMVMVALRRIIRAIDLHSRHLVAKYGLTGPQLALLRELSTHEGVSVGQLTRALHLSQATVTGILDRLAKRDIVRRQRSDQDRRRVEVWLTETGKQLLTDAPPLLQEQFTDEFGKLEDWEQSQILSSLQRVVSMMEAKDIDATPILATGPIAATVQETEDFLDKLQDSQGLSSALPETGPAETLAQEASTGV
jgi:DNA-binding MarR family transcriptional regulator